MWRFYLYRTVDPSEDGRELGDFGLESPEGTKEVWRHQLCWLQTGGSGLVQRPLEGNSRELAEDLASQGEENEPRRIGAAYRLASSGGSALAQRLLEDALHSGSEGSRRAAMFGLAAAGTASTEVLLRALAAEEKWLRRAATFALGEAADLTEAVLEALAARLEADDSVYVRAVAAGSLGCLGRRAAARGVGVELLPRCLSALTRSLGREANRPAMDQAQRKMIKFVRPTEECDVCEGSAVREPLGQEDYFRSRFRPVRSAVRENSLWSLVMLCSQRRELLGDVLLPTADVLVHVVELDENVVCVGFALDALHRLAYGEGELGKDIEISLRQECARLVQEVPVRSLEPLSRSGCFPTAECGHRGASL